VTWTGSFQVSDSALLDGRAATSYHASSLLAEKSGSGRAAAGFVATRGRLEPESGATVLEVAGTFAMFGGPDSPLTQTFGLGVLEPVKDPDLDVIEAFFRERAAHVDHEVCPLAGVDLTARLVARGYRPIEMSSVTYRPLADGIAITASVNPGLRVRSVGEDEGELWAATGARGWSDFGDFREMMRGVARVHAHLDGAHAFLVELDGKPVAAGGLPGGTTARAPRPPPRGSR